MPTLAPGDWGALYAKAQPKNLPRPLFDEWSWQLRGNCKDHPIDLFYPEERGRTLRDREEVAKRICRDCPVIVTCRDYALRAPEAYGIWGALTPRERARALSGRAGRQTANVNIPGGSISGSSRQS